MDYIDYPTSPYSEREQQRIMRDVQASFKLANEQHDEARIFYISPLINHDEDYD